MTGGEIQVWRVALDEWPPEALPAVSPEETARADRYFSEELRRRYLAAHGALRAIVGRFAQAPLAFSVTESGKPYLPAVPELRFSLSRSHTTALVSVALDVDLGVDIERLRPIPEHMAIAERFFPASDWAALAAVQPADREREFCRRWTRIEACLKALGVGLYGAGAEFEGPWTVETIDAGPGFAAAVAARQSAMAVSVSDFRP